MKLIACLAAFLMLSGCAISKKVYLPSGENGYSISCDGAAVGINVCFEKAGALCGAKGYEILNREGQVIPTGLGIGSQQEAFVTAGAFSTKSIMIKCRN